MVGEFSMPSTLRALMASIEKKEKKALLGTGKPAPILALTLETLVY